MQSAYDGGGRGVQSLTTGGGGGGQSAYDGWEGAVHFWHTENTFY